MKLSSSRCKLGAQKSFQTGEKRDILLATCGRHFADASGIKCHEKVKLFHAHVITAKCYITLKFFADPLKLGYIEKKKTCFLKGKTFP